MKKAGGMFIIVLIYFVSVLPAFAEVPKLINYSGKLTNKAGNIVADGVYDMKFILWDQETGGTEVWNEEHYIAQTRGIQVAGGSFNVILGGTSVLPDFDQNLWMELTVRIDSVDETFGRQQIVSVAYAMRAEEANHAKTADDGVPSGTIILWTGASCPVGYRRLTELDGLFPRGAGSYSGEYAGGADSHSHGGATQNGGVDHTHSYSGTTGTNPASSSQSGAMASTTGTAPIWHNHSFSGQTGGATAYLHNHAISSDSNVPRYFNVIFCLKE
ncbi:hypothetical protein KAR34_10105 [bacterium]|nr:hypothetical protein [bacterium]